MLPNLVLIGFMGCGKSSVGRRLATLTGHRFVDTDELVVQSEHRDIPEIFSVNGEAYYRQIERQSLEGMVGVYGIVLSTGGGIILCDTNRQTLKRIGIVAWLDASPDTLFERAIRSGRRPLLQTENPRETFDRLLQKRRELYGSTADFRIDCTCRDHDETAHLLLDEALRKYRSFES
jgi:shikimate kinase